MIVYVDSSVVLRALLGQPQAVEWRDWEFAYSSEIISLETRRVIDRLRLESVLDDDAVADAHEELRRIEQHIGRVPLSRAVLVRAGLPMPTVVKTLDAIHLTSALMLAESKGDLTFVTHDRQQSRAARAFGFSVLGS